ncbi:unnamed protein product [Protopolystoma xenopodis]|uniref:Uncharacterized protein n=1 Tax=Protopolystoma xenopodis TaxID=117903 RepID=A0A448XEM3_9PLAT|nr:unnamed protein product [Protopolystoma xenopodis]
MRINLRLYPVKNSDFQRSVEAAIADQPPPGVHPADLHFVSGGLKSPQGVSIAVATDTTTTTSTSAVSTRPATFGSAVVGTTVPESVALKTTDQTIADAGGVPVLGTENVSFALRRPLPLAGSTDLCMKQCVVRFFGEITCIQRN